MKTIGSRIIIIGCSGSGKSTLALKLGTHTKLPVYHLDKFFWKPGWTQTPKDEWIEIQDQIVSCDKWIIDGNYGGTMDIRMQRADTVIFLDFNRWVCLLNVLKRWVTYYGRTRPDVGLDCKEKMDLEFIKWVLDFPKRSRPAIIQRLKNNAINQIVLKSQREVEKFVKQLSENHA